MSAPPYRIDYVALDGEITEVYTLSNTEQALGYIYGTKLEDDLLSHNLQQTGFNESGGSGRALIVETGTVSLMGIGEEPEPEKPTGLVITKQPEDARVVAGEYHTMSIEAEGDELSYQWYYCLAGSTTWKMWAKTAELRRKATEGWDGMKIRCVVTDKYGNTESSQEATITIGNSLRITK